MVVDIEMLGAFDCSNTNVDIGFDWEMAAYAIIRNNTGNKDGS